MKIGHVLTKKYESAFDMSQPGIKENITKKQKLIISHSTQAYFVRPVHVPNFI